MHHGMLRRLRALTLLVALCTGFLGQMAMAMPMTMQMPQDRMEMGGAANQIADCPTCPPRERGAPESSGMTPACMLVFCSMIPAVMPSGSTAPHAVRANFPRIAVKSETGLTIRPDLGPPRSNHQL
jgi:hypothetical protein